MHASSPHMTLLALHQLIDAALQPLFEPMDLQWATENYVTIDRTELDLLARSGSPQAAIVEFDGGMNGTATVIAEPSLCSAVLARIWNSSRNQGAPFTQVEGEIVRQFVTDVVGRWRAGWAGEGMTSLPRPLMVSSLSMLTPQLIDGPWHVARTVISDDEGSPVGVLLFAYPAHLVPQLEAERERISWRARIARGLSDTERERLYAKLTGTLNNIAITAPVTFQTQVQLGVINALERGDVIGLPVDPSDELTFTVLDREVTGRLARTERNLALLLTGPGAAEPEYEMPQDFDPNPYAEQ